MGRFLRIKDVLSRTPTSLLGNTETSTRAIATFGLDVYREANDLKYTLSGALTAATYKTIISVTGAGVLHFAAVQAVDATARDIFIRVTLDGTVILTKSMVTVATANCCLPGVGGFTSEASVNTAIFAAIPFNSAMLIEIKSSLTETDKLALLSNYRTV